MAKIKYFFKNYEEAQKYAFEAKNLFENYNNNKKENYIEENYKVKNKDEDIIEKKTTQNVSNILSFFSSIILN